MGGGTVIAHVRRSTNIGNARALRRPAPDPKPQDLTSIRAGRGLGDSLYLRPIVEHLIRQGQRITALTDYPQVFDGSGALTRPFTRSGGPRVAHYTATMHDQSITQYQAMLRRAEIFEPVPLAFAWQIHNRALIDELRAEAAGRPLILVHGGRTPMQRTDSFSVDLMPRAAGFEAALHALRDCYRVRVGNARNLYSLPVDRDLGATTSITDLLDLGWACDGVVAQCSFAVPLAEVFDKPLLAVWAANGLRSAVAYIRTITPRKILTKAASRHIIDDWPAQRIGEVARAFRGVE